MLSTMQPSRENIAANASFEDEETELRYLTYLKKAQNTDLSEFDKLGVVYHSGKYISPSL